MIKFLKLENFKDQPDHPARGTDYFMSIGKFHVRLNSKPRGIQMGWDCRFWRTGWFFSVSSSPLGLEPGPRLRVIQKEPAERKDSNGQG